MVVDPPDGRVPVLAWAEAKRDFDLANIGNSWVHETPWVRCITRGFPAGMFPAGYNNAYQIVQVPGYVVIASEMIHETRIIPLDGRPRLGAGIRLWNGDPRGRWEGDTLVVETTNFNDKGSIATSAATGRIRGIPQSEAMRRHGAVHAQEREHDRLSGHDRRPEGLLEALDRGDAAQPRRQLPDVRVLVPRGEQLDGQRAAGGTGGG